jgi:rhodanese-related sulfurtransferase/quercetin dioxygenase-like cupin family protein
MLSLRCLAMLLLFFVISTGHAAEPSHDAMDGASLYPADKAKWKPGPPSLPPGASMAVLEGDPTKEGPFVFRVKVPDGYRIPPHIHPKSERVTVIAGTFNIGMGDTFDANKTQAMPTGAYGHWPAGMRHYVWAKGETVVQFHGDGPWTINYLIPADDPRNANPRRTIDFTEDSLTTVKKNVADGVAVLVDVRSQEEWNQGHLEGSIFVPVTSLQKHSFDSGKLEKTLPKKDDKVILYTFCVVGMRAKQAGIVLEKQGYTVRALKPGYEELVKVGFQKAEGK